MSAGKRKAQKKTKASEGKGAKPTLAKPRSNNVVKESSSPSRSASTPQRSQKSRSTPEANVQSQQAALTSLFKFRRYKKKEGGNNKKAKHPKLIVEENESELGFMGLTEEPKSGHHKNIKLTQNPKKGDTRSAYIRKELRHDKSDNFYDVLENYNLSEKDKQAIIEYLNKRKKKK